MTQSFEQAQSYIAALTGNPDAVCDWRCINDRDKGVAAHNMRGTIREMFPTLQQYNQNGWGIFVCINEMDGQGRELSNVHHIRTHVVDMDNPLTSQANYQRAVQTYPAPHFAVQSSPNKYHVYWLVEPYTGNEFYTLQQRKLAQVYDGDTSIIDPTRVLRVPGFYHLKAEPFLTHAWGIHNGARWHIQALADSLAHVNVINHIGIRSPLGDPEMQAPSLEWLNYALHMIDPNSLDRQEWLSITAAFKQAGWNLIDEARLHDLWEQWCAKYKNNNAPENTKLWNSIRDTEVGWAAFERRTAVKAYMMHNQINPPANTPAPPPPPEQRNLINNDQTFGEILSPAECAEWFKDCYFVARLGEIFSRSGRFMNSSQFNGLYGGKIFQITNTGKTTDDAWKAALRSTQWTIPKVDHTRFLPDKKPFEIVTDRMGRKGLNTYIPIIYDAKPGDVTPWLNLVARIIPNESDRNILLSYMAHCVKYPGYKIPWAPLVQSTEGVGKTMFSKIMEHALGEMYIYKPKAPELISSGSKFNAWMRNKVCILVDEIKIDERRELIEILKPMITDAKVEVQAKGQDQEMEDNPANWMFFSNYKDAIPINKNGRRYAIFFSTLQSKADLLKQGMDDAFFAPIWTWLEFEGGLQAITYWLLNYPIEKGQIPRVAPETSSYKEALRISRSPMQIVVDEAVEDNLQGFRGGYVSTFALIKRVTAAGIKPPSSHSIRTLLENMGYKELGRAVAIYPFEDLVSRPIIYANDDSLTLEGYGDAQGYVALGVA